MVKIFRWGLGIALCFLWLSGCAHYWYVGRMNALDSGGKERDVLVYWNRTERALWFDTVAGAVRVKTQCGSTIVFEEKEDGVIFRARPSDQAVGAQPIPLGGVCGRIVDARRIGDLTAGELHLDVQCQPRITAFSTAAVHYLQAGRHNFQIIREARPVEDAPDTKRCDTP